MELFGLFQILQNLLNTPTAEPSATEPTAPTEQPTSPPEPAPVSEDPTPNQTAILDFLDAHNERAKRIKKS